MTKSHVKTIKPSPRSTSDGGQNGATSAHEVLTLAETAAYLRVPETEIVRLAQQQDLPGRLVGGEWRFLKLAIQAWLQTGAKPGSKEAVLSVAGAWKDDAHAPAELEAIYQRRGRAMTEVPE